MDYPPSEPSKLRARVRQQEVVAELGQQALDTDDLDQLMHDAAAAVAKTLDNEYGKVLELLPDGEEVFLRQGVGWRDGLVGEATVPTDLDSQAGFTLISEEPIIVENLRTEERFTGPGLLTSHDVVSGISVLIGSVDDPWGVLGTHTSEYREFTAHDAHFVQSVANILASAIVETTTKEQLREREAELDEVYGRVTDGFFALDKNWEFTHVNEQAEEILDRNSDELVETVIWNTFPDLVGTEFEETYREAMATQEPASVESYFEPYNKWFEARIYPSETGLSVYFRDVTDQKHLEGELEKTFNRITDAFIGLDPDWEITYVNERGSEILDPDDEGLVAKNFWDPFEPALGTTFEEEYREAMATQEPTSFEEYYPPLGVWFEVHAYPSESGLSIYFRDITERKERERQLEESERRYRTLVDCFPNGVVTLYDRNLEYTIAAGQAFDELPVSADEVEGGTPSDVWGESVAANLEPLLRQTLDGKEGDAVEVEYAGRTWIIHAVPVRDDTGDVFAGMTMAQDITERKEIQRQLEESERRYRVLAENFPGGAVGVYDHDLRYTLAAGEKVGDPLPAAEEVEGTRIPEVFPDEVVAQLEPLFRATVEEGESGTVEIELAGRHWRVMTTPLRDSEGEIFAGLSFAQDITEQIDRQQQLEESNERLEQFAYAASHDLQEPLRMVSSYLSLIEGRYSDELNDDAEEFLEFAVDGAERMREMIDGLLEYSRVDTQGDPFEPVDLDCLVAQVQEDLQVRIEESNAEITIKDLPRVEGDPTQLRQVFQNLLGNAITYSGDNPPQIHVEAEQQGRKWLLSVSDEGIGIDADDQDRVFQVFQRLHSRDEHAGTGLGLALCQRIVERHGGEIWVESDPGEGSTFSFTLPATRA